MTLAVGFVGLGRIGKPIAANILAAGFDLMVFDVREEPMRELAQLGAKQRSQPAGVKRARGDCGRGSRR